MTATIPPLLLLRAAQVSTVGTSSRGTRVGGGQSLSSDELAIRFSARRDPSERNRTGESKETLQNLLASRVSHLASPSFFSFARIDRAM